MTDVELAAITALLNAEIALRAATTPTDARLTRYVKIIEVELQKRRDIEPFPDCLRHVPVPEIYTRHVHDLDLSVRAMNVFAAENIWTIGDLVSHTADELLKFRNFYRTSLHDVQQRLDKIGLRLGMEIPEEHRKHVRPT